MRHAIVPLTGGRTAVCLIVVFVAVGCGGGSPATRPTSPPPAATDVARSPAGPPTSRPRTPAMTVASNVTRPTGWDSSFCGAFAEVAVGQELAVDVGRALDEDDDEDALALSLELEGSSNTARQMLDELPEWEPAQAAVEQLASLVDLAGRVGRNYRRFLEQGREQGLERAQELAAGMRPVVDDVLADVRELQQMEGLDCPGTELTLEAP